MSDAQINALLPSIVLGVASAGGEQGVITLEPTSSYLQKLPIPGQNKFAYCFIAQSEHNRHARHSNIIGSTALRKLITLFDFESNQIAFAPATGC